TCTASASIRPGSVADWPHGCCATCSTNWPWSTGRPQPPAPQFWIMLTYLGAQYLLAEGVLEAADSTEGARHRPDPLRVSDVVRQFFTAARASTMP
ncbi:hypothetical protein ABT104_16545, partial [Streptomyces mobaraensis]